VTSEAKNMTAPILVTGGTGTLGKLVVARLQAAGHPVRILNRANGDLTTGEGVADVVAGIETIIHCAGTQKGDGSKTRTLVAAARDAKHLVFISVVGADRVPVRSGIDRAMFGYFASKLDAERAVIESGIPYSILRATQFHDLMLTTVRGMSKLPLIPVPSGFRFQPVDADEVAARLVELALGEPAGLVPDLAGPRVYTMREMVRGYVGGRRLLVGVRMPGGAARAYRDGANLALDRAVGRRTWEEFLVP
jgi:uncharacterized protein YbjT (DUF2867 family)